MDLLTVATPSPSPRPRAARRTASGLAGRLVALLRWTLLLLPGLAAAANVLVVLSADLPPYRRADDELEKSLKAHGHSGTSVVLDQISPAGAADFTGVAVAVGVGTQAAAWLNAQAPATVALAYCMVPDPTAVGLGAGRAANGVTTDVPLADQIRLIGEALPNARNVGMFYRSDQERGRRQVDQLRAALPAGWKLEAVAINEQSSIASAIDALMDKKLDLVWTSLEGSIYNEATVRSLLLSALRRRVPVFGFSPSFVRAGALLGIGIDPAAQGRQTAEIVDRLLVAKPEPQPPLPGQTAPLFEIAVNLVVAQKLSIDLPAALIGRATHVFQPGR